MSEVLVSIVVPVYNVEEYLEECLDSLINQTLEDIEIICVDNCSTDKSAELIASDYLCDSRIRLITNEKNMGMPFSRNSGLKNAMGKYVAFVDADDVCDVTMFEKLYKMAEKTDADITTCGVYRFYDKVEDKQLHHDLAWYKEVDNAVHITHRPQQLLEPAGWCKLYRRTYIQSIGFEFTVGSISCEDVPCATLAFLSTQKIAFVHEALYYYRFRENGNLTASMGRLHIDHYLWAMNRQKEITTQCGLTDELTISYIVEFKYLMAFYILSKIGLKDIKYYFSNIINAFTKEDFIYLRRLFAYVPKYSFLYRMIIGQHRYLYLTYKIARRSYELAKWIFHIEDQNIYRVICLFGKRFITISKKNATKVFICDIQTIRELTNDLQGAKGEIDEKEEMIEQLSSELARKQGEITALRQEVGSKSAYYKEVWCTGFIDSWKDYCIVNYKDIADKKKTLLKGLDAKSIETAELLFERNVNILPRQKYTKHFLYNHKKLYTQWEMQGVKNESNANDVQNKYRIPKDAIVENTVFEFENGLVYVPQHILNRLSGRDVIDGGAYWGDSVLAIDKYKPRSIRCFEPSEKNYHKLLWMIENNELQSRVVPVRKGLSDTADNMTLYNYGLDSGANVLGIDPIYSDTDEGTSESIEMTTIDAYADREKLDVGLIKLDVEGYELEAIKGAQKTIALHRPILLVSLYHSAKDFFDIKPMIERMDLGYHFMIRKLAYHDLLTEIMLIGYCDTHKNV